MFSFSNKKKVALSASYAFFGTLLLALCAAINPINHYATAFALILGGFLVYFFVVFLVADKNWLDVRAVFSGVWLVTIGLAAFRITGYQEQWQPKTWLLLAASFLCFQIGATFGISKGFKWNDAINSKLEKLSLGRIYFHFRENRLFTICVVSTAFGLVFFIVNALIKGYIPAFSSDPHAYVNFYTSFQIFALAGTGVSGICYYTIKTQDISKFKKFILYFCILYNTFLYPVLVASRGTFLASAISLTVAVFYLHKKKFIALVLALIVMFSVYWGCSYLRNYSDEQLTTFFEPEETVEAIPPKFVWVYSYLTVSHDNFNEAVQNTENYTYGARQFVPFNSVFRFDFIKEINETCERHLVRPHLNTTNLIGDFFYDFGSIGVVLCTLLWSFVFGLNQSLCEKNKGFIYLGLLGNTLVPVVLCFFATWTSVFSQWLLWGVVLLYAVAATLNIKQKTKA